jgi:hypothetical protein
MRTCHNFVDGWVCQIAVFVGYYQSCVENCTFKRGNLRAVSLVAEGRDPRMNAMAAAFYDAWSSYPMSKGVL